MRHLIAIALAAIIIIPGFGGQGPLHSHRCRGEALPRWQVPGEVAQCTRHGWRIWGTSFHGG